MIASSSLTSTGTAEDRKKVIWSDETKINFIGPDGKQHCLVKAARFSSKLVKPTVKFGGGSIIIWGCMTGRGAGSMRLVIGRMDSKQYSEILDDKLMQTMSDLHHRHSHRELIFQKWLPQKHIKEDEGMAQEQDYQYYGVSSTISGPQSN